MAIASEFPAQVAGQQTRIIETTMFMGRKQRVLATHLGFKDQSASVMIYAVGMDRRNSSHSWPASRERRRMDQLGLVEIAGIGVVLGLVAWQFVFFQFVRPRIMQRIGRRLDVEVHESLGAWDAGVFDTENAAPIRKTAAVAVADFVVTLAGTVGVFATVSIPLCPRATLRATD